MFNVPVVIICCYLVWDGAIVSSSVAETICLTEKYFYEDCFHEEESSSYYEETSNVSQCCYAENSFCSQYSNSTSCISCSASCPEGCLSELEDDCICVSNRNSTLCSNYDEDSCSCITCRLFEMTCYIDEEMGKFVGCVIGIIACLVLFLITIVYLVRFCCKDRVPPKPVQKDYEGQPFTEPCYGNIDCPGNMINPPDTKETQEASENQMSLTELTSIDFGAEYGNVPSSLVEHRKIPLPEPPHDFGGDYGNVPSVHIIEIRQSHKLIKLPSLPEAINKSRVSEGAQNHSFQQEGTKDDYRPPVPESRKEEIIPPPLPTGPRPSKYATPPPLPMSQHPHHKSNETSNEPRSPGSRHPLISQSSLPDTIPPPPPTSLAALLKEGLRAKLLTDAPPARQIDENEDIFGTVLIKKSSVPTLPKINSGYRETYDLDMSTNSGDASTDFGDIYAVTLPGDRSTDFGDTYEVPTEHKDLKPLSPTTLDRLPTPNNDDFDDMYEEPIASISKHTVRTDSFGHPPPVNLLKNTEPTRRQLDVAGRKAPPVCPKPTTRQVDDFDDMYEAPLVEEKTEVDHDQIYENTTTIPDRSPPRVPSTVEAPDPSTNYEQDFGDVYDTPYAIAPPKLNPTTIPKGLYYNQVKPTGGTGIGTGIKDNYGKICGVKK